MTDLYKTSSGRKFFDKDLPRLIDVLEKIANGINESNQLKERSYKLEEKLIRKKINEINKSSI